MKSTSTLTIRVPEELKNRGVLLGVAAAVIYSVYIMAGTTILKTSSPLAGSSGRR